MTRVKVLFQKRPNMPSFGTLILGRFLEHYSMLKLRDFGMFLEVYRKRPFLVQTSPNVVEVRNSANFAYAAFSEVDIQDAP